MEDLQSRIQPPEKFDFKTPEKWSTWLRRFERYRLASRLTKLDEDSQVSTLIYVMGPEAEDVINSLKLKDEDFKSYTAVTKSLNDYFIPKKNLIYERAKFNLRVQQPHENIDSFITALHNLADQCEYKDLRDELIRDRFVVGLLDKNLSERLQLDSELTLQTAVLKARQTESVRKQQSVIQQSRENVSRDSLNIDKVFKQNYKSRSNNTVLNNSNSCIRCGKGYDKGHMSKCPALKAKCKICSKVGHFAAVCLKSNNRPSKAKVGEVTGTDELPTDSKFYLGAVGGQQGTSKPWKIEVRIEGENILFKVDPGADVTVISEDLYNTHFSKFSLQQPRTKLFGPCDSLLLLQGMFTGEISWSNNICKQDIYVVKDLKEPLLGRPAVESLNILKWIHEIGTNGTFKFDPKEKYPELFSGLGKMDVEYDIKLKPDAEPYILSSPRRVALPLRPKLKEELDRMQQMGVISSVETPTEWCSGIVIVPKPNGKIRICIDLTKLNTCVQREHMTLPTVDETLANLAGAKYFSKLDANCGYWQMSLSEKSKPLTTFITPFGRYYFNRLPFGISSAPEIYSREIMRILVGTPGVVCHMDDVLIYGKDEEEHFRNLDTVLKKLSKAGITLNEKCVFNTKKVKFLGHMISSEGIEADPTKCEAIINMPEPNSKNDVRRLLGMVTYIGKFLPNLAQITEPLRQLVRDEMILSGKVVKRKLFLHQ